MNKKLFIFILFLQLSGLVQSYCLYKKHEAECGCEENNNILSNVMTNAMSQISSLFNAVYSVGNWINYMADVAGVIAEESVNALDRILSESIIIEPEIKIDTRMVQTDKIGQTDEPDEVDKTVVIVDKVKSKKQVDQRKKIEKIVENKTEQTEKLIKEHEDPTNKPDETDEEFGNNQEEQTEQTEAKTDVTVETYTTTSEITITEMTTEFSEMLSGRMPENYEQITIDEGAIVNPEKVTTVKGVENEQTMQTGKSRETVGKVKNKRMKQTGKSNKTVEKVEDKQEIKTDKPKETSPEDENKKKITTDNPSETGGEDEDSKKITTDEPYEPVEKLIKEHEEPTNKPDETDEEIGNNQEEQTEQTETKTDVTVENYTTTSEMTTTEMTTEFSEITSGEMSENYKQITTNGPVIVNPEKDNQEEDTDESRKIDEGLGAGQDEQTDGPDKIDGTLEDKQKVTTVESGKTGGEVDEEKKITTDKSSETGEKVDEEKKITTDRPSETGGDDDEEKKIITDKPSETGGENEDNKKITIDNPSGTGRIDEDNGKITTDNPSRTGGEDEDKKTITTDKPSETGPEEENTKKITTENPTETGGEVTDNKKITTDETSKSGGRVEDKKNMKTDEPSEIGGGVKGDEDTPADQPYNELENKQTNDQDKTLGENNDKLDIRTGQPTVEEDKDKAHIKGDQQNKTERLSMDDGLKVERSGNNSVIIKWSTVSGAGWKLKIDRLSKTQEIKELALGTTFYNIKNVDEGDVIHIALFDGKLWHDASPYEHRETENSTSSRSAATGSAASSPGFEVERNNSNSFIIKWTTPSKADWKLSIHRHNPDEKEEIKILLGTTFYEIENVNEDDIIDIAFFDGSWHKSFKYKHRESESSTSSRSATESSKDNSFKVERSTDNSFIVKWTRGSGADWKILIDGVRPSRQRETIQIPLGTTFYKYENVNEGDIIDVTFFDGSWHEGFRYDHQDSESSISSRSAATGSASSPGFEVERSTGNSIIIKWTTQSKADWELNITRHNNPEKQETIKIPLNTTFYKIENVNEGDIIDIAFFDGSWHKSFQYEHRDSDSSTSSRSAATGSASSPGFEVERSTKNSVIIKWTTQSKAHWKLNITRHNPDKQEEIKIPLGTTFYKIENVNEGDIIDIALFDGEWHDALPYEHHESQSSASSRSAATGSSKDNSFQVERSTDNSFIVKWTRASGADWKILIDAIEPYRAREEISIPHGTTFYEYENVNEGDIIDVTFFDGSWHEGFRYQHQDPEGSISSRLGATGTAKDNSFKVERSTDNSLIVKWTRGSAANWKLLIDGVRPWKQREEISIPLGTTSYKIENVNKDDIIDVTFFDGSWHETFRHEP
ncbi:hypothetical protein HCN44_005566 [Aphidius gifuensis]|uniref:Venom protein n=1 Tax=Aphidius gifuensis TaxID=684658 RepID=A0A835CUS4_APHGI|nr:hypothetical protein HCN44_005566 [Aphidius gifuensis]